MNQKLDELYLNWLYSKVEPTDPTHSYWKLMMLLFRTRFEWFVDHDGNRARDGQSLRRQFIFDNEVAKPDDAWFKIECSMLEMLVALAERMSLQMDHSIQNTFWRILTNAGLLPYRDENFVEEDVNDILATILDRRYEPNGQGGLFPLRASDQDQRNVELIYQMYAYIMEIYE